MLKITIPQSKGILFEANLEPIASEIDKLRKNMSEGEINAIFGKKNKVAVGVPYYENLISRYIDENKEIAHEVKKMMNDYDFHYVSLSCSFLPDSDCRFIWARFGVELSAISKSGEAFKEKPIAYYMFPDEVLNERKYKRDMNLEPELKIKLFEVAETGMKTGVSESSEFVVYEPQIFAYGIRRPSVSWNFKSTREKGIWGNKYLLLIVRSPKNSKVRGKFLLGAEVESYIGKWVRILIAKRKDNKIVNVCYDLSE
ncbi:MAG TPA: hypothetical protein VN368_02415 [Candidatus Methylomirabilis sp.]|nr:hypothetical protein [Candidatus Methylomirabilis sp.]